MTSANEQLIPATPGSPTRICARCKTAKPLEYFYISPQGVFGYCMVCSREKGREYYARSKKGCKQDERNEDMHEV